MSNGYLIAECRLTKFTTDEVQCIKIRTIEFNVSKGSSHHLTKVKHVLRHDTKLQIEIFLQTMKIQCVKIRMIRCNIPKVINMSFFFSFLFA